MRATISFVYSAPLTAVKLGYINGEKNRDIWINTQTEGNKMIRLYFKSTVMKELIANNILVIKSVLRSENY
jgi:hypothetical protein